MSETELPGSRITPLPTQATSRPLAINSISNTLVSSKMERRADKAEQSILTEAPTLETGKTTFLLVTEDCNPIRLALNRSFTTDSGKTDLPTVSELSSGEMEPSTTVTSPRARRTVKVFSPGSMATSTMESTRKISDQEKEFSLGKENLCIFNF